MVPFKNVSHFGPVVWSAIADHCDQY